MTFAWVSHLFRKNIDKSSSPHFQFNRIEVAAGWALLLGQMGVHCPAFAAAAAAAASLVCSWSALVVWLALWPLLPPFLPEYRLWMGGPFQAYCPHELCFLFAVFPSSLFGSWLCFGFPCICVCVIVATIVLSEWDIPYNMYSYYSVRLQLRYYF